ncbi:MAG: flagellin [Pseudomonadota bacterium]|nr:flagellin [Pseudomonadota bacterium]
MTSVSNAAVGAFLAGNAAAKARHGMNEAIARLSTGVRSMYGGDAAGASVANQLRAEGRSALMAARNCEDGISFVQAGESALLELAALNSRLRELVVQNTNGLLTAGDKAAITVETTEIKAAAVLIDAAELNGNALIAGAKNITVTLDAGTDGYSGDAAIVLVSDTVANVDAQGAKIAKALGSAAAGVAALKGHQANLYSLAANSEAAAARIQDTDFARSSANLAKFSILNQSAMAMVAQANQASASVLAVLQ